MKDKRYHRRCPKCGWYGHKIFFGRELCHYCEGKHREKENPPKRVKVKVFGWD